MHPLVVAIAIWPPTTAPSSAKPDTSPSPGRAASHQGDPIGQIEKLGQL